MIVLQPVIRILVGTLRSKRMLYIGTTSDFIGWRAMKEREQPADMCFGKGCAKDFVSHFSNENHAMEFKDWLGSDAVQALQRMHRDEISEATIVAALDVLAAALDVLGNAFGARSAPKVHCIEDDTSARN
jgi:hypothetical protein